jgi:hypothetical protein
VKREKTEVDRPRNRSIAKNIAVWVVGLTLIVSGTVLARADWQRASDGQIPAGAVSAGREANGEQLYLCRANFKGGVHPGKIRPAFGGCNVPWGGAEHAVRSYEVLVGSHGSYSWTRASGGGVPPGALAAGREANGDPLYICRGNFQGGVHPGKVRQAFGACNVPWGGGEHKVNPYDVLMGNPSSGANPHTPGFDAGIYYRLTTMWQGECRSLDIVNDGNNDTPILARTGNFSGQHWKIEVVGDGYYRLTTQWQGRGRSLDIVNDGTNNNKPILANTGNFSGQHWRIEDAGNGYFRLTTAWQGTGKSLDIINDGSNDKPILADTGNFSGQYWKIEDIAHSASGC